MLLLLLLRRLFLHKRLVDGVVVAHRSISWWVSELGPHWTVACSWQGQPLACEYVSTGHAGGNCTAQALLMQAHALVSEDCWDPADVPPEYRHLPQVMFTMEPFWPCHASQAADLEMTYRSCSQVIWVWPWQSIEAFPAQTPASTQSLCG